MKAEYQAALYVGKFLVSTVAIAAVLLTVVHLVGINWTIVALLGVMLVFMIRFMYQVKLQEIRGE